ncbi:MAG: M42 family metallopeptidase [Clostridiales bacterium]|nr:M42 family metallopeptidase [Clostridiales bacterium]
MLDLIKTLVEPRGVTGDEAEIAQVILALCRERADSAHIDKLGNVIAFKKGKSGAKQVMADAHMDEVGFYINLIGEDGLLKFTAAGIDPRVVIGRRVLVGKDRVPGVVGAKPIHLQSPEEREIALPADRLFIDIGARDAAEAKGKVRVGDTAIFESDLVTFGDGFVKARALDNRTGCAVLLEAMREQPHYDTTYVFSVLEESGGHGARVATMACAPDVAIVIDTTTAADHVEKPEQAKSCIPGEGTVIFLMESTTYYSPASVKKAKEIAAEAGVRWQHKRVTLGGLNSGSIQRTGRGVETIAVATPCRYLHSSACTAKLSDVEETRKLVTALLTSPKL